MNRRTYSNPLYLLMFTGFFLLTGCHSSAVQSSPLSAPSPNPSKPTPGDERANLDPAVGKTEVKVVVSPQAEQKVRTVELDTFLGDLEKLSQLRTKSLSEKGIALKMREVNSLTTSESDELPIEIAPDTLNDFVVGEISQGKSDEAITEEIKTALKAALSIEEDFLNTYIRESFYISSATSQIELYNFSTSMQANSKPAPASEINQLITAHLSREVIVGLVLSQTVESISNQVTDLRSRALLTVI